MSGPVFIRLDPQGDAASWRRLELNGSVSASGHGPLAEVASSIVGSRVIVVVPGEDVLLCRANVPGYKKRLLAQAVPYALEEQLATDVDELHFAIGQVGRDEVAVAVVAHDVIAAWLAPLRAAGIDPHVVIPETLLLPWVDGQWQLLRLNDKYLLRHGVQDGLAMDPVTAPLVLKKVLEEAGEFKPSLINIYEDETDGFDVEGLEVEIHRHQLLEPLLQWMAAAYDEHNVINLLQGRYSRRERWGQYWRPWRVAASLMAAWLVIQVGMTTVDYLRLSSEHLALKEEIETIYRQTFPEARKVVNPRVQMERALSSLRGGGSAGGGGFADLLAQAGGKFKETEKLDLQRVSYKDGLLDVSLLIGDLQQLDQLKQRLVEDGQLQVEIQSATSRDQQVDARLRIKGNAS